MDEGIPKTVREARERGYERYFTGIPCKHGHLCERKTVDRSCVECNTLKSRKFADRTKEWRENNKERDLENKKRYYEANKEEFIEKAKVRRLENPEDHRKYNNKWRKSEKGLVQARQWYADNQEAHAERTSKWKQLNPEKVREYTRTRQAMQLKATPEWRDRKAIQKIYKLSVDMEANTGVRYSVDHIVPLQHSRVCGLHTENNLQVLTYSANSAKQNRIDLNALSRDYEMWLKENGF